MEEGSLHISLQSLRVRVACLAVGLAGLLLFATGVSASAGEAIVHGLIWEDIDGDGEVDAGEPPVALDPPIYLARADGFIPASIHSKASGQFEFPPVPAGAYRISLPAVAGLHWVVVHPQRQLERGIEIPIDVGAGPVEVNIGLVRVSSLARFVGQATIAGVPVEHPIVDAVMNGKVCSFQSGIIPASGASSRIYSIAVASDVVIPGCAGELGAPIRFRVNGQPATETATWQPVSSSLLLTVDSLLTLSPANVGSGVRERHDAGVGGGGVLATLALIFVARGLTGRALRAQR